MAALILGRSIYRTWICARPLVRRVSSLAPSSLSPMMLIEDQVEGKKIYFNFYSLADKTLNQLGDLRGKPDGIIVGSSRGWLAFYKPLLLDIPRGPVGFEMCLYDPVQDCYADLPLFGTPPVHIPMPIPPNNKSCKYKMSRPNKVILSCCPKEEECRAIMSYGPENRLAYCCPKHSTVWTPIGDPDLENKPINGQDKQQKLIRYTDSAHPWTNYKDFVYSTTRKQLFCVNRFYEVECWDLSDTLSPRMIWKVGVNLFRFVEDKWFYLVFAERSNRLFIVRRTVVQNIVPYPFADKSKAPGEGPYQTVGFVAHEIIVEPDGDGDSKIGVIMIMENTLDNMAFFIGSVGDGFVIERDEMVNNVEPNCIYYTDPKELTPPPWYEDVAYGGHDLGVYDYQNRAFSSLYKYPLDFRSIRRIQPTPTWIMPSRRLLF